MSNTDLKDDLTGLGRRFAADPRDKDYLLDPPKPQRGVTRKTWYVRGVLDQGSTSQCVAYSASKLLTAHPVRNKLPMSIADFYRECQRNDEWPGEDYDGTSVRAAMKVLKRLGYIGEYRWTYNADDVVNYLLSTGPMQVGTDWYMAMFTPDRHGFIQPEGASAGGHAYLLIGVDIQKRNPDGTKGAVRILNSWGEGWGNKGRAWLALNDLQLLLSRRGEAAVATELAVA